MPCSKYFQFRVLPIHKVYAFVPKVLPECNQRLQQKQSTGVSARTLVALPKNRPCWSIPRTWMHVFQAYRGKEYHHICIDPFPMRPFFSRRL